MNTRTEAALMISAGVLLSAGASLGLRGAGDSLIDTLAVAVTAPTLVSELDHGRLGRLVPCQDLVEQRQSRTAATISTHDDRGGYRISIVDGELREIDAEGGYALEEDGDTVRILDPDGVVAYETSRSNPTLDRGDFVFHLVPDPAIVPPAPISRASLGANLSPVDTAMAAQLGIEGGAVVESVLPGSGADAGGLRQYDVIVGVDGVPIGAWGLTAEIIGDRAPGDTVEVDLLRRGKRLSIGIALGSSPVLAPRPDGIRFEIGDRWDLDTLLRILESRHRDPESRNPRSQPPAFFQGAAPTLGPAPAIPSNPEATDASEMLAPRTHTPSARV